MTAAAASGQVQAAGSARSQADVWSLWRQLGELHYSTTFMARQVGRLLWRVELDGEPVSADDSAQLIAGATAPLGPSVQTAAMALHMQVAGEYRYRLADDPPAGDGGGWRVTPPTKSTGLAADDDEDAWLVDLWTINRDPVDPSRADSPVRAAADVAAELVLLSALARSQARNRSAQRGLLLYPAEQTWDDEGPSFDQVLQQAMTAPLADEHAASAVVPPQVPTPSDLIASWRLLELSTDWDDDLPARIEHATRRLATVLDHPPEVLLGIADVNHWSAWQISEDTYRAHVEPLARWPAQTLARAIAAVADVPATAVVVEPDPVQLLQRTPTVADTIRAYELGLVSDDYTRSVLGAGEEDAGTGVPLVVGERVPEQPVDVTRDAPDVDLPDSADPQVAAVPADQLGDQLARIDAAIMEAGLTATQMTVTRIRERIGAKLRTAVRSDSRLADLIDGVPNVDVAAKLGPQTVAPLVDVDQLASDTADDLLTDWWSDQLERATAQVERVAGIAWELDEDAYVRSVRLLIAAVAHDAVTNLYDPPGVPPVDAVRRAMEVAGGGEDPGLVTAAAAVGRPGTLRSSGFARGADALQQIRVQTGLTARQWRWRYGDRGERENPHPGHVRLDGTFMTADGTATTVDPRTGQRWTAYPGDHKGCLCDAVPVFVS